MNRFGISYQRGVGMIEVLVAILILSTSLMALAAMQMRSLQYNQSAYFESQANMLVNDIVDRMRLNRGTSYNSGFGSTSGAPVVATIGANAVADVDQWNRLIEARLPNGKGSIACIPATAVNGTINCTIVIRWDNINNVTGAGSATSNAAENRTTLTYYAGL